MNAGFLSANVLPSLALVCALGFRHGFDADHIAVIDGMTRVRQLHRTSWTARLVGAQFAFGHSAAILLAALLLHGRSAALPPWLNGAGLMISTCFLLAVAISNGTHALRGAGAQQPRTGPITTTLLRLTGRQLHPALVGMAFAMSFDAMAQAAYFASRGGEFDSAVLLLAVAFGLGMLAADASNGALLNWFARRSDQLAAKASQLSSGFIALLALSTAISGIVREFETGFAHSWDGAGMWIGITMVAATSLLYSMFILVKKARQRVAG